METTGTDRLVRDPKIADHAAVVTPGLVWIRSIKGADRTAVTHQRNVARNTVIAAVG